MSRTQASELGIQSWCFRKYDDVSRIAAALAECGVNRIELCGIHVDWNDPARTVRAWRSAGITISGFGVNRFGADEAACRKAFDFAALAGIAVLSADVEPESLDLIERLCGEYHCKLAQHNHGRRHRLGSAAALDELFRRSSPNIGLCLDTAWMLDSGEDPVEMARRYRERLYGVHFKDFVFDRAGRPEDVVTGTGNLDLPALAGLLDETGFDGYLTIEYEGDPDNPTPALRDCADRIRRALDVTPA